MGEDKVSEWPTFLGNVVFLLISPSKIKIHLLFSHNSSHLLISIELEISWVLDIIHGRSHSLDRCNENTHKIVLYY